MSVRAYNRGSRVLAARITAEQRLPTRPIPSPREPATPTRPEWVVGDWAFCTVTAIRGWYRVTAVNPKDGRIKVDPWNTWNPLHNFQHVDKDGRGYTA